MLTIIGYSIAGVSALGLILADIKWGIRDVVSFHTGKGRRIPIDSSISERDIITGSKTTGFIMKTTLSDDINPLNVTSVNTSQVTESEKQFISKGSGFTATLVDDTVTDLSNSDLDKVVDEMFDEAERTGIMLEGSSELTQRLEDDAQDETTQLFLDTDEVETEDETTQVILEEPQEVAEQPPSVPDFLTPNVTLGGVSSIGVYEATQIFEETPLEQGKNLFDNVEEVTEVIGIGESENLTVPQIVDLSETADTDLDETTGKVEPEGYVPEPNTAKVIVLFENLHTDNIQSS